jgi:hypothetical protein
MDPGTPRPRLGWKERCRADPPGPRNEPGPNALTLRLGSDPADCRQERLERSASPQLRLRLQHDGGPLSGIARQLLEQDSLKAVASLGCRGWRRTLGTRRGRLAKGRRSGGEERGACECRQCRSTQAHHEITPSLVAPIRSVHRRESMSRGVSRATSLPPAGGGRASLTPRPSSATVACSRILSASPRAQPGSGRGT